MVRTVVVLLKNGQFDLVECAPEDIFVVARIRNAGICGVFDNRIKAQKFVDEQGPEPPRKAQTADTGS